MSRLLQNPNRTKRLLSLAQAQASTASTSATASLPTKRPRVLQRALTSQPSPCPSIDEVGFEEFRQALRGTQTRTPLLDADEATSRENHLILAPDSEVGTPAAVKSQETVFSTPVSEKSNLDTTETSSSSVSSILYILSPEGVLEPVSTSPASSALLDSPLAVPLINTDDVFILPPEGTTGSTSPVVSRGDQTRRNLFGDGDGDFNTPVVRKRKRQDQARDTPRARKRSKNSAQWKQKLNKEAAHSGKEYVTKKGKVMSAKVLGPPCKENCRLKCRDRVTEEDRQIIFCKYYSTSSQEKKWDFISRLLLLEKPERPVADTISGINRSTTVHYQFRINNQLIKVCQTMFLNTLQCSEQVVRTVIKKLGPSCGTSPDKRGSHGKHPKIPVETTQSVLDHINSFPRVASHFCRANSTREYLEEEVGTVANMFRLYELWVKDNGVTKPANYRQYLDIFNGTPGLNISFFKPKKDQCDTCFAYKMKSPEQKEEGKQEHEQHLRRKNIPQDLKRSDRLQATKSADFCAAVFDLQKVLFVPKCEASILYYHRKFSNYNFTVWDMGKKDGYCYLWNEVTAKRGSNEVASFVLDFIHEKVKDGISRFSFYCDNCSGQNKNRMVFAMFLHAAAKFNVDIMLRFLMTGHTQNEGDSMHARIETETKASSMFVSEDWWKKIETAKKDGKSFQVKRVTQQEILDFHDFVEKRKSVWTRNTLGEEVSWSKIEELCFSGSRQGIVKYKYDMESEDFKEVDTKFNGRGHPVNLATHKFPKAYQGSLPISVKKKADLILYCDRGIIPSEHHDFYSSLKTSSAISEKDDFYCQKLRNRKP